MPWRLLCFQDFEEMFMTDSLRKGDKGKYGQEMQQIQAAD